MTTQRGEDPAGASPEDETWFARPDTHPPGDDASSPPAGPADRSGVRWSPPGSTRAERRRAREAAEAAAAGSFGDAFTESPSGASWTRPPARPSSGPDRAPARASSGPDGAPARPSSGPDGAPAPLSTGADLGTGRRPVEPRDLTVATPGEPNPLGTPGPEDRMTEVGPTGADRTEAGGTGAGGIGAGGIGVDGIGVDGIGTGGTGAAGAVADARRARPGSGGPGDGVAGGFGGFDPGDTGTWRVRDLVPGADGGRRTTTILHYLLGLLAVDHVRALTRWAFPLPVVGLVLLLVHPRWIGLAVAALGVALILARIAAVRLISRRTLPRRYRPVEDDLRAAVEAGKANLRGELRRVGLPSSALALPRSVVRLGSSDSRRTARSRLRDIEIDRVLPRAQLDRALRVLDGAPAPR